MPGGKWAQKIQLGGENPAAKGTAVPATTVWRGEGGMLEDLRETNVVNERIGVPMPSSRTYAGKLGGQLNLASTPATPEQLPHLFEAGIQLVITGTADGTSSGYKYEYALNAAAANSVRSYTVETGDNVDAERMTYAVATNVTLTANAGEAVMMAGTLVGRSVLPNPFTAALTPPTVTDLLAAASKLWIDDDDGAFGGTPLAPGNLLSWTLTLDTGWKGKWTVDSGELHFMFAYYDSDSLSATLELKWEHDTAAVAEKAKWRADATRLVRIEVTGRDYVTVGTGSLFAGKKGLRIDFPGRYTKFAALTAEDGNSIVVATLIGGYDEVSGEVLAITVANELAVIP